MQTTDTLTVDQSLLKPWHFRALSVTIIAGVSLFLGMSIWVGWDKMSEALLRIGTVGFSIAISLTLANLAIRLFRWQFYLKVLEIEVPILTSTRIYVGGLALSATPGKAGEAIRGIYLKPYGASYIKSLALFLADRFTDLVAVLILASAVLWSNEVARPIAILLVSIITLVMVCINYPVFYAKIATAIADKISWKSLSNILLQTVDVITHCKTLFNLPVFFIALLIAISAWSLEGLSLFIISSLLEAEIAFLTVLSIYAFSKLIGAISMIPGGMGTTEATLIGLFLYQGVDEATAITCALFLRLTTFWFVTTLGLISLPSKLK